MFFRALKAVVRGQTISRDLQIDRMLKRQVRDSRICGQGEGERGKHEYFGGGVLTFGTV